VHPAIFAARDYNQPTIQLRDRYGPDPVGVTDERVADRRGGNQIPHSYSAIVAPRYHYQSVIQHCGCQGPDPVSMPGEQAANGTVIWLIADRPWISIAI
jgi:hypothetical protein